MSKFFGEDRVVSGVAQGKEGKGLRFLDSEYICTVGRLYPGMLDILPVANSMEVEG
jgi:hypothetical protein